MRVLQCDKCGDHVETIAELYMVEVTPGPEPWDLCEGCLNAVNELIGSGGTLQHPPDRAGGQQIRKYPRKRK